MPPTALSQLVKDLTTRFGENFDATIDGDANASALLQSMAGRGSCRAFANQSVPKSLLNMLSAIALSAPSKSDLQQRDIVLITDPDLRKELANLVPGQAWVAKAPYLIVFCANNRRQRLLHQARGIPFENDHLDAFFNASVDAAIALGAFVTAAEASRLGCCPISAIRNEASAVSDLLNLPDYVFPIAGLALGYPAEQTKISMRLPLPATLHENTYGETNLTQTVQTYDTARANAQPYQSQRDVEQYGHAAPYTWSEDKMRQYCHPERADFGAFIRAKGFRLD